MVNAEFPDEIMIKVMKQACCDKIKRIVYPPRNLQLEHIASDYHDHVYLNDLQEVIFEEFTLRAMSNKVIHRQSVPGNLSELRKGIHI